jgi:hypothetical protein
VSVTATALRTRVDGEEAAVSLHEETVVVGSKVASTKEKPVPIAKRVAVGDRVSVEYVTIGVIKRATTIRILAPGQTVAPRLERVGRPAGTPGALR